MVPATADGGEELETVAPGVVIRAAVLEVVVVLLVVEVLVVVVAGVVEGSVVVVVSASTAAWHCFCKRSRCSAESKGKGSSNEVSFAPTAQMLSPEVPFVASGRRFAVKTM